MSTGGPHILAGHKLNLLRRDRLDPRKAFRFFDEFGTAGIDDTTTDLTGYALDEDAGATAQMAVSDKRGGWLGITCDGDDNDASCVSTRAECVIFNGTDEVFYETVIEHAAGSTDGKSSFALGVSDLATRDLTVDAGTAATSFDGAVFVKEEDGNISFVTSNATSQTTTQNVYTWVDGHIVRLGFFYDPNDGTTAKVTPVVNGEAVGNTTHDLTISGLAEMHVIVGQVKTHEAAEQELEVDWYEVVQRRNSAADPGHADFDATT
jgi:hypothetical protein